MKICQVHPACGISVPPKGWGAIEQIVWEFHQSFLALGMDSRAFLILGYGLSTLEAPMTLRLDPPRRAFGLTPAAPAAIC